MGKDSMTCKEAIQFWAGNVPEGEPKRDPATAEKVELFCMLPSIKKMDNKLNDLSACTHLALSTNCIDRMQPLPGLKNLKILSLGRNNIKRVEKLDDVAGHLEELWISYNQIEKLDGFSSMRCLRTIFMSNNHIKNFDELLKLATLDKLEKLLLLGNPCYDDLSQAEARREVIRRLPKLKQLDGVLITEKEKQDALAADP